MTKEALLYNFKANVWQNVAYDKNNTKWDILNIITGLTPEQFSFTNVVMHPKDGNGMVNIVDPGYIASQNSLIWVCTAFPVFRIFTI